MKLMSAFRKYFALNAAQREFIKKGKRSFNMLPGDILNFFKPLAAFDENLDEARAQVMKIIIACIIFIPVAIILIALEVVPNEFAGYMLASPLIGIVILALFRWFLGSFDLHNNLRNFAVPVINSIGLDMAPDKNMLLKIDLSGKLIKSKLLRCVKDDPGWFTYPKTTTNFYRDYWFACSAQLADGSNLKIDIKDAIRERRRQRRNPRGKIKTKTKVKISHKIKASLALKNKTYSINETPELRQQADSLKIKDKDRRKVVSLCSNFISTNEETSLDPQMCLNLIGKILMNTVNTSSKGN